MTDAYDGEWDISKPLYLNLAQTTYMYKASIPEGVKCLSFKANAQLSNLEVYDADGKRLNPKPSNANTYTYSDIVELNTDVITTITYADGTKEVVRGTSDTVSLCLLDSDGKVYGNVDRDKVIL